MFLPCEARYVSILMAHFKRKETGSALTPRDKQQPSCKVKHQSLWFLPLRGLHITKLMTISDESAWAANNKILKISIFSHSFLILACFQQGVLNKVKQTGGAHKHIAVGAVIMFSIFENLNGRTVLCHLRVNYLNLIHPSVSSEAQKILSTERSLPQPSRTGLDLAINEWLIRDCSRSQAWVLFVSFAWMNTQLCSSYAPELETNANRNSRNPCVYGLPRFDSLEEQDCHAPYF